METTGKKISFSRLYKVSACTALAMILFFLLMKLLGLVTIVELRFLNFVIIFIGIRYMLLEARRQNQGKLEYLSGMLTGFLTAFCISLFFAVFLVLYLYFDKNFMAYLKVTQPFGSYLTPGSAALVNIMEDISGGAILAFALMHILNRDNNQG